MPVERVLPSCRRRPRLPAAVASALLALLAGLPGPVLAQDDRVRLIQGPRDVAEWEPATQEAAQLPLPPRTPGGPGWVVMRHARPAGIDYRIHQGRQDGRLPVGLDDCSELFGCNVHYVIHSKRLQIEAASHDFDGDGVPELVFALGRPELGVVVNVLKAAAPRRGKGPAPWRLVGRMEAPGGRVEVAGDSLLLPYGSLGLIDHWRLARGRFVRVTP